MIQNTTLTIQNRKATLESNLALSCTFKNAHTQESHSYLYTIEKFLNLSARGHVQNCLTTLCNSQRPETTQMHISRLDKLWHTIYEFKKATLASLINMDDFRIIILSEKTKLYASVCNMLLFISSKMKLNNMLLMICFVHADVLITWHHSQIKLRALFSRILFPIFELAICCLE